MSRLLLCPPHAVADEREGRVLTSASTPARCLPARGSPQAEQTGLPPDLRSCCLCWVERERR